MMFNLKNGEVIMQHNLVSHNQLAGWKSKVAEIQETSHESAVNDYFQCLTECDDNAQLCKRICREVLD